MKIIKQRLFIILFAFAAFFSSCSKDENSADSTGPIIPAQMSARDSAVQDYNLNYIGSNISGNGWTGSTTACSAGAVSPSSDVAVIQRINYFRHMVGLNDDCTLDTMYHYQEQQAALMMSANYALSHTPPTSWSCYSSAGASGAASSNIALGYNSSESISAFISDNGSGNTAVGHRRWILHSTKQKFSYGATSDAMALYVFLSGANTKIPPFIAFPPKNYIPQQLVPIRWSFSIPGADFSLATVSMTGPSGNVPLTIVSSTANGYGDNTIVWEPVGIDITNASDVVYTVTVSNVGNDAVGSHTYSTTIIKP